MTAPAQDITDELSEAWAKASAIAAGITGARDVPDEEVLDGLAQLTWELPAEASARLHHRAVTIGGMDRCNHCKQELIEIDNRGQRLTGCLTCNLWSAPDSERWTRLSEEDLRELHLLSRHGPKG